MKEPAIQMQTTGTGQGYSNECPLEQWRKKQAPRRWSFKVINTVCEGAAYVAAESHKFCFVSPSARDAMVKAMVCAVQEARSVAYRIRPSISHADFGDEVMLADGCFGDHGIIRYQAALENAALGHGCAIAADQGGTSSLPPQAGNA